MYAAQESSFRVPCGGKPIMNDPLIIGLIVFAVILAGAITGWKLVGYAGTLVFTALRLIF